MTCMWCISRKKKCDFWFAIYLGYLSERHFRWSNGESNRDFEERAFSLIVTHTYLNSRSSYVIIDKEYIKGFKTEPLVTHQEICWPTAALNWHSCPAGQRGADWSSQCADFCGRGGVHYKVQGQPTGVSIMWSYQHHYLQPEKWILLCQWILMSIKFHVFVSIMCESYPNVN